MPSPLVHKYAVYVHLSETGKVRQAISRETSLFLAVESCIAAYKSTGHFGYWIEDQRTHRTFVLDRQLFLALVLLKASDQARYFRVLNQLDQSGDQAQLESNLSDFLAAQG